MFCAQFEGDGIVPWSGIFNGPVTDVSSSLVELGYLEEVYSSDGNFLIGHRITQKGIDYLEHLEDQDHS